MQQTTTTDFRGKSMVVTEDLVNRIATKSLPAINSGETGTTINYTYDPNQGGLLTQTSLSGDVNRKGVS